MRTIELLAPARDALTARAAIDHGADAVYIGPKAFGARAQAGNPLEDIQSVVRYAHRFGVRVYVTVNTIVYEQELAQVERMIWDLWRIGVDALIVQDLALTQMKLPPIALHASTQCDIRTPRKARRLWNAGFTRLVLPRELTLNEIAEIRAAVPADLEVFVHGALCVSFSGDCQASFHLTGRSANRGECCQVCRFKFDLEDATGRKLIRGKHLLSLKDMNRLNDLESLLEAGAVSLKIEGRLKDTAYVKNVVSAYSEALNRVIRANPGKYRRASDGVATASFTPDASRSFNRGFTSYFLTNRQPERGELASFDSPKSVGRIIGEVVSTGRGQLTARVNAVLNNGDGLGYFSPVTGEFNGFRLNRAEAINRQHGRKGNDSRATGETLLRLFPAIMPKDITPGTKLYRNFDKAFEDALRGDVAVRRIPVDITLERRGDALVLSLCDESGCSAEVCQHIEWQTARTPQLKRRAGELKRLGDTIFSASKITDLCTDSFIPASVLGDLRRRGVEALEIARRAAYRCESPGKYAAASEAEPDLQLTRHDNIANSLSAEYYAALTGKDAASLPRAIEIAPDLTTDRRLMQTRYCLRRELGACLKSPEGARYPSPLFLSSNGRRFRLEFDCRNCRMNVCAE